jgi:argininosuccinate lyase
MKLWTGRLSGAMDETFALLNNSLPFDQRMTSHDIIGSISWAQGLHRAGLLSQDEANLIVEGLQQILQEYSAGQFQLYDSDEDIHTAVERRLTEIIGPLAGKLHTGRSRNDQVATDFRLWTLGAIEDVLQAVYDLQKTLVERAQVDDAIVLPGYTHMQQAQPILMSHWWLSHFWALERDRQRLLNLRHETKVLPLGSGALAGTGFNIDRFALAEDLGFREPAPNSLDAIADRDFAAEFLFCAALLSVHLSRLAEALMLFSTREYGFVVLADSFSTGSSLMPQKKNADPLELVRAKSGMMIGRLTGLLATLKALPSAYDKDLQEDKEPVFDTFDSLMLTLPVMSGLIKTLTVNSDQTLSSIDPLGLATDLADYLVERDVPFREAHSIIGKAVKRAETEQVGLIDLPIEAWKEISPVFEADLYETFDVQKSLERRSAWGGTSPQAVIEQLTLAKKVLANSL